MGTATALTTQMRRHLRRVDVFQICNLGNCYLQTVVTSTVKDASVRKYNPIISQRWHMNNLSREFELLLGHAAFKLWPDLPRDMQEKLFEAAVPNNPLLRYSFAVFLHEHHPRTAHPPKPTNLA